MIEALTAEGMPAAEATRAAGAGSRRNTIVGSPNTGIAAHAGSLPPSWMIRPATAPTGAVHFRPAWVSSSVMIGAELTNQPPPKL